MPKKPILPGTHLVIPDYWHWLRWAWIIAEDQDRWTLLHALFPELPDERISTAAQLDAEETKRHYRYQLEDAPKLLKFDERCTCCGGILEEM